MRRPGVVIRLGARRAVMLEHHKRRATTSDGHPWPPEGSFFAPFGGRQRRLTMSRIAGATLPAQKTRKDDHTHHPSVIEGTKSASRRGVRAPKAARDDVRKPRNAALRVAFPVPSAGGDAPAMGTHRQAFPTPRGSKGGVPPATFCGGRPRGPRGSKGGVPPTPYAGGAPAAPGGDALIR